MTLDYQSTEIQIKYDNGKVFNIVSKQTKKGERFYVRTIYRLLPISKQEIQKYKIN